MSSDRDIILRRRARFIAAALAATGVTTAAPAHAEDDAGIADAGEAAADAGDAYAAACLCACATPSSTGSSIPGATLAAALAGILIARRRQR